MNDYLKKRSGILEPYEGLKANFCAVIERLGLVTGQRTLLLKALSINGKPMNLDHLWVRVGDKTFEAYVSFLAPQKRIRFNAWVRPYIHGYYSEREIIDQRSIELGLWRVSSFEVEDKDGEFKKATISKTPIREKTLQLIEKWAGYIKESHTRGHLYGRGIAIILRNALKVDYDFSELDKIIGEYTSDINDVKRAALRIYPDGSAKAQQNREWQSYMKRLTEVKV